MLARMVVMSQVIAGVDKRLDADAPLGFLLSGGLTLAYMAKLFTVLFLEKGKGEGRAFLLSMPVKVGVGVLAVLV